MIPSISLNDIIDKWVTALSNNVSIIDFCANSYGATAGPTIFVGLDAKNSPQEADCPYIIILDISKEEGPQQNQYSYRGQIGWAIKQANTTTTDKVKQLDGVTESVEFGQLILEAINEAGAHPVTRVAMNNNATSEFAPQFPGVMDIEIDIDVCLGAELVY